MPIEIRRFGVGNRRPGSPPGTSGVQSQVIHSDARGTISELALARGARIKPHSNPNSAWFIVIEGGGWVLVGDEKTRIAAGEAAVWPADELHAAWTEHGQMRAFVVELAGADDSDVRGILEGVAEEATPGLPAVAASAGQGALAEPDRPGHPRPGRGRAALATRRTLGLAEPPAPWGDACSRHRRREAIRRRARRGLAQDPCRRAPHGQTVDRVCAEPDRPVSDLPLDDLHRRTIIQPPIQLRRIVIGHHHRREDGEHGDDGRRSGRRSDGHPGAQRRGPDTSKDVHGLVARPCARCSARATRLCARCSARATRLGSMSARATRLCARCSARATRLCARCSARATRLTARLATRTRSRELCESPAAGHRVRACGAGRR